MARKSRARKLATVDCETDPFLHGRVPLPFLWDVFDGEKHYTFDHTSDVVAFLEDEEWIVYAHNGGKYDYLMPGFLAGLESGDKITVINGRLAKFKMGACEFRDSVNILPIKLADFQKEEIDYSLFERKVRKKHMKEITAYLHKDTEYLYQIVKEFRDTYGDGLTLAGSAMKFWQGHSGQSAPHSTAGFYEAISPYYYGGRCECFHVGIIPDGLVNMVDINSAYPYAMLHDHPIDLCIRETVPRLTDPIIPQSMYHVRARSRGAFPLRMQDGSLRFPAEHRGDFYVTGWEMQAARDTGTADIERIHIRLDFEKKVEFKKYIAHFYEMKKSAKKGTPEYIFAKLFMNSLYGKFGANPNEYANYQVVHPSEIMASGMDYCGDLGNLAVVCCDLEEHEKRFYNAATAASITGFVRAYLWRHICKVREAGGEILYADTDSIMFQGKADVFPLSKELGDWSVEDGSPFVKGGIGGKKLYALQSRDEKGDKEWKKSCKGVDLEPEQILDVCRGLEVEYKRAAPSLSYTRRITGDAKVDAERLFVSRKTKLTGRVG